MNVSNNTDPRQELDLNQIGASITNEGFVIPVIEEQVVIGRRMVETGVVRIAKHVLQEEQTISIPLAHEVYNVERVVVNQYVDTPPAVRQEGDVTIYPVLQEVLVTEKRLMLLEEVRVTKRQYETTDTQQVPLRREEIIVERIDAVNERPV